MAYNKDTDYQALINDAVAKGDYASASRYEQARNEKIDTEGLSYEKTEKYKMPNGVTDDAFNQYNQKFTTSDEYNKLNTEKNDAASNYKGIISQDIISDSTKSAMNQKFVIPSAVTEADAYLSSQLQKIQSGKTSYSDDVKGMLDKIMNREKFSYDVDTDPLFQQALASAMNSGKQAMQDTIGQASALTGGYGSTYATSAGNQAYNAFIEDAYDNLPQYYQMAMDAYQMEGDEMYRQFGMLSDLDDKEYNRTLEAYDATYQHRNQMYNEAYTRFRDNKSDAFAMANIEISEHGQRASDAYNYYNIASNEADKQYERDYQTWSDSINQAWQMMGMQNTDWWKQSDQDFTAGENEKDRVLTREENAADRAHQSSENALDRSHQSSENALDRAHDASESQKDRDFTADQADKDRTWQSDEANKDRTWKSDEANKDRQHDFDLIDYQQKYKTTGGGSGGGGGRSGGSGGGGGLKNPTESQMTKALAAYEEGGMPSLNKYLNAIPENVDVNQIAAYVGQFGELPMEQRTFTKTTDTTNWFWGVDGNDVVTDQYGNEYRVDELPKDLQKDLSKLKRDESYTKK